MSDILEITFGGLCSFVEQKTPAKIVNVLLVEAHRSKVRGLCRHHRYLLFRGSQLWDASGNKRFYRSFVGHHPEDEHNVCEYDIEADAKELVPETYCLWDIDGCDLTITTPDDGKPDPIEFPDGEKDKLLALEGYGGGLVAPQWLADRFPGRLVGSRMRLNQGRLRAGKPVCGKWAMCLETGDCDKVPVNMCQTVIYTLERSSAVKYVTIYAKRPWRDRWIKLSAGAKIFISNLCPFQAERSAVKKASSVVMERDVLAYYELCGDVVPQEDRKIPHLLNPEATPNKSACPPVVQTAAS